ncbi:hypothetical protein PHY01_34000 [Pseudonocardia hydrocarbonoxydans]|uniref:Uncharacterized protein n=2 Tax=Pseudonocardia hydrocarbonoxydans TaxID=76726 RepID=A0A4Y3WQF0_9PSEU|nr:hypothetical protein PHY01_34000 [Pseudonocardia hydrocarbonoxydans]
MLITTDRGDIRTAGHIVGDRDLVEYGGRQAQVTGDLNLELRVTLAGSAGSLADVEYGGPACTATIRDAVLLRWVRERATIKYLDGDPGPAVPVPPDEPGAISRHDRRPVPR